VTVFVNRRMADVLGYIVEEMTAAEIAAGVCRAARAFATLEQCDDITSVIVKVTDAALPRATVTPAGIVAVEMLQRLQRWTRALTRVASEHCRVCRLEHRVVPLER
jgi:hypothetical protein